MSKYHELVKDYAGWIEQIKAQQAELDKMQCTYSDQDVADVNNELQETRQALAAAIEYEYETVPYCRPRNAGISGFWREAGLEKPA